MFDKLWLEESRPLLNQAFNNYIPRSNYILAKALTHTYAHAEAFNVLGYKGGEAPLFQDTWKQNSKFKELSNLFRHLFEQTKKTEATTSFITFSFAHNPHERCPTHVHNFINGKPSFTTTFAIPLHVANEPPCFFFTEESRKWPTRYYIQPEKIPTTLSFNKLEIDTQVITKIEFNSSFHAHYISYTEDVVAWLVIDGADHDSDFNFEKLTMPGFT